MPRQAERRFKPNMLCIAPPYAADYLPAGAAYLLGYLKAKGCFDFDFLDLQLGVPDMHSPTFRHTGVFADAYVMDIPDLPLVLLLLNAWHSGAPLVPKCSRIFQKYCLERAISPNYLQSYLTGLNRYFASVFDQITRIDFIGFSVWTTNYLSTLMAAARLKRRKKPPLIVAGGPQVTASDASGAIGLRSGLFDVIVQGEGEETLLDVYNEFSSTGRILSGIPGTLAEVPSTSAYRRIERPLLQMEALPPPSFAEMHIQAYQDEPGYRTVPLQMSRGCTDKCEFCGEWMLWRRFRPDTPYHVTEQIEELQRSYGANFILFSDSLLNGVPERLVAFAEQLLKKSIDIGWAGFMRAQMDTETAALLARAGCNDVFVGIESFSDETLKRMNKRRTMAENMEAVEALLKAGIGVTAGFIPGFPGDTREAFIQGVDMLQDLQRKYPGCLEIHVEPFLLQPNAPMYGKLETFGLSATSWADEYLDLTPRYRDITSDVFCAVYGAGQGIERLGRVNIINAIKTDAPLSVTSSFQDEEEEALSVHEFDFRHIFGGWYLAARKSNTGHIYALLVNHNELEEIEELQSSYSIMETTNRNVNALLSRLERCHIVPPKRRSVRVVRTLYRREASKGCIYAISPFVVARAMDWRHRHQVLMVNVVSGQWYRKPANEESLIAFMYKEPRSERQLWKLAKTRRLSQDRDWLRDWIKNLNEEGILVICDEQDNEG